MTIKTQFWAGLSIAVGAAGWAVMMASGTFTVHIQGFTAVFLVNITVYKNNSQLRTISELREAGRCWMELVVPSWSDLCFRFCELHSLEQLTYLSLGCIWPRYNTAENLCFECYFNPNSFWCRHLLPIKPFLVHFRSPRIMVYNVLCCGYFVVLQKKKKLKSAALARLIFCFVESSGNMFFFFVWNVTLNVL